MKPEEILSQTIQFAKTYNTCIPNNETEYSSLVNQTMQAYFIRKGVTVQHIKHPFINILQIPVVATEFLSFLTNSTVIEGENETATDALTESKELSVEEPSVEEPSVEEPSVEEPSVEEPSVEELTVKTETNSNAKVFQELLHSHKNNKKRR